MKALPLTHSTLAARAMRKLSWTPGEAAEVSVLGEGGAGPCPARILEMSGRRMRLATAVKATGGAAIRLEWGGQLVLGQVDETEPGGFWMEIHHMLLDSGGETWPKQEWLRG